MMFPYNRLNEIFDYVRQDNIVSASQLSERSVVIFRQLMKFLKKMEQK